MKTAHTFTSIEQLDLDQIKNKLMHPEAGEGWSQEKADSVEKEYRRFLCVMKAFPDAQTSPLIDVDTFWHYHILDTRKYAADCESAFGYFLHHFPYLGLRGEEDEKNLEASGERMRDLYESLFDEPYAQDAAAWCAFRDVPDAATRVKAAWCAFRDVPQATARVKAAWCAFTDQPPVKGRVQAAWCAFTDQPPAKERLKAAWCAFTDVPPVKSQERSPRA